MEKLLKATEEMYTAGNKALVDPDISEKLKQWIRKEMELHKKCMKIFGFNEKRTL